MSKREMSRRDALKLLGVGASYFLTGCGTANNPTTSDPGLRPLIVYPTARTASAINAAINTASAAGGGTVALPGGIINITETIIMKPQVKLMGEGMTSTKLNYSGSDFAIRFGNGDFLPMEGIELSSFQIACTGTNPKGGIIVSGAVRWVIEKVWALSFKNTAQDSAGIIFGAYSWIGNVRSCRFFGCDYGIRVQKLSPIKTIPPTDNLAQCFNAISIDGQCEFQSNLIGLLIGRADNIALNQVPEGGTPTIGHGSSIRDVTFENNTIGGLWNVACDSLNITSCYFESNKYFGARIGTTAPPGSPGASPIGCAIINNEFSETEPGAYAAEVINGDFTRILDNNIVWAGTGVMVQASSRYTQVDRNYVNKVRVPNNIQDLGYMTSVGKWLRLP